MEYIFAEQGVVSRNKTIKKVKKAIPHYHEINELYYMREGETTYFIENEIFHVEQGNFVFIPKGLIHNTDYSNGKNTERILVSFPDEYFEGNTQKIQTQLMAMRVICIPEEYRPQLETLLIKIEEEYQQQEPGRELLLELYIKELLILLCRYHRKQITPIKESDKLIYNISEYIQMYFCEEMSLASLSKTFAVSESFLSRKFKAVAGIGLNQYITAVRINNGARLLLESKLSVTEIAERCGYDSNYFASVFKKIKGVTPLTYRKQRIL